MSFFF
jgi:hypothetical protein